MLSTSLRRCEQFLCLPDQKQLNSTVSHRLGRVTSSLQNVLAFFTSLAQENVGLLLPVSTWLGAQCVCYINVARSKDDDNLLCFSESLFYLLKTFYRLLRLANESNSPELNIPMNSTSNRDHVHEFIVVLQQLKDCSFALQGHNRFVLIRNFVSKIVFFALNSNSIASFEA